MTPEAQATPADERNFYTERLKARLTELRQRYEDGEFDYETFKIEATKVLVATARNEKERKDWQRFLRLFKVLEPYHKRNP
jgi:hypothetical protein